MLPLVLLSACETMNKYVIPPDWQSMDAFKASLKSKKVDTKPVFITDFRLEPSLKLLTESEIKKGKVSISNDAKLEITYKESYEYYYKQWSSNQYTPGYERYKRTTTPSIKQNPDELELNLLVKNDLQHSINSNDFSVALFINGEKRDIEIMNPTKIIPNTSETLIFKGPKYLELNPGDKISLRLFDVTTETNLAGAPSKKESFTWDMIYSTEKSTLEKPLYSFKVDLHLGQSTVLFILVNSTFSFHSSPQSKQLCFCL